MTCLIINRIKSVISDFKSQGWNDGELESKKMQNFAIEDIEKIIRAAEKQVDAFVKWQEKINSFDGQMLKFPRFDDDKDLVSANRSFVSEYDVIPFDVTLATIHAVQNMERLGYLEGKELVPSYKSERIGDYAYDKGTSEKSDLEITLGQQAVSLLGQYVNNTGNLRVYTDGNDCVLNSRQRHLKENT